MVNVLDDGDPNSSVNLLYKAQDGDAVALNDLLARYLPRLRRWASGRLSSSLRSSRNTQDIVQDAVLKALPHLGRFEIRNEGSLMAYLRQAVRNRILDLHRQHVRRPMRDELPEEVPAHEATPLSEAIGTEAEERYERALELLSADDRAAVVLKVEFGLSHAEIAERLKKPSVAATRMAVSRAIARLAAHMAQLKGSASS